MTTQNESTNGKVFAIGFNKSASTSLHHLFESLGRRSYHGPKWRNHRDRAFLDRYDSFSDGIPRDLAELDRLFPGSKFILNVRDLRGWIFSRLAHIERTRRSRPGYRTSAKWDTTEAAVRQWILERNEYHLFVLAFFSERPADLLVVNFIRDAAAANHIGRFLGHHQDRERPRRNVNPDKRRPPEHVELLQSAARALAIPEHELDYDLYCPSLEPEQTRAQFPPDTGLFPEHQTPTGDG